jgi:hypothetical protein
MDKELVPAHPGKLVTGIPEIVGDCPGKPPGSAGLTGIGVVEGNVEGHVIRHPWNGKY